MTYRSEDSIERDLLARLLPEGLDATTEAERAALDERLAAIERRLDVERRAVSRFRGRVAPPRRRRRRFVIALALLAVVAGVAALALDQETCRGGVPSRVLRGDPAAFHARPIRHALDQAVEHRFAELDACVPEGGEVRVHVEMIFEGRRGAIAALHVRNVSERSDVPSHTWPCLDRVLRSIGTTHFRAPSYTYALTLEWRGAGLERPPLWDRHRG